MLKIGIKERGDGKMVTFEGDLTIEHAEEVWRTLCDNLGDGKDMVLHLQKVTSADISCLQIICAAHRASEAENRVLEFDGTESEPFVRAAWNSGFVRYNCGVAKDTTACLWKGIANE
jgi:ABC-type transporter Mla MlaB component